MWVKVDVAERCRGCDRLEGVLADAQHSGWTPVPSLNGLRVGHRVPGVLWRPQSSGEISAGDGIWESWKPQKWVMSSKTLCGVGRTKGEGRARNHPAPVDKVRGVAERERGLEKD